MLRNYLKVAFRAISRQKIYAGINVFGLACGLAFCLLIILFIRDEVSYDRFLPGVDRIYRVEHVEYGSNGEEESNANGPFVLAPTLDDEVPEVAHATRIMARNHYLRAIDSEIIDAIVARVLFTDSSFLRVLPFELVKGAPETALADPSGIVLSQETARKHFGTADPIGKVVELLMSGAYREFVVTAIAQDPPANSTIQFEAIARFERYVGLDQMLADRQDNWGFSMVHTYVRLLETAVATGLQPKLDAFIERHLADRIAFRRNNGWNQDSLPMQYAFTPMTSLHFSSGDRPLYASLLSGLAILILAMACINFTMLAIGRSAWRAKEVGVRKVVGAERGQLMKQFWCESILMSGFATLLSVALVSAFLPIFNDLTGKSLQLGNAGSLVAILGLLALATGLLAGSYPAFMLSGLWPVHALRGRFRLGGMNGLTRTLVVTQFALTGFLLIGALVMGRQIRFLAEKELGFNQDRVLEITTEEMPAMLLASRLRPFLQGASEVRDVTAAGNTFGYQGTTGMGFGADGKSFQINVFPVEANHIEFFDLELLAGRDFDPARSSDTTEAILVNEALIRSFELVDPLGKQIPYADKHRIEGRIVGVVKDYNFQALYQQVGAAVLTLKDYWGFDKLFVRLGDDPQQGIARLREAWNEVVPGIPLEYRFLDDRLADVYSVEQRWSRVARYGAIFATVIACLGLLGLTVLTITGRIKEIGIRKVLGASSGHIVQLISRDFGKLVGVGFVIAAPLAFLALTQFLNLYAFHIPLGPNVFIVAGVLMGVLAFSTVGILTLKASQQDPVDSLRYE